MAKNTYDTRSCAALLILQILQQYSSENKPLKQSEIIRYLERDFGVTIERKKVARDVERLIESGYEVEQLRGGGYYLPRDFEDSELRFLIDNVLFSRQISNRQRRDLIAKLADLGTPELRHKCGTIVDNSAGGARQSGFFNMADKIREVIDNNQQLQFVYCHYEEDKQLHPTGPAITVNPIALVCAQGRILLAATAVCRQSAAGKTASSPIFYNLDYMQSVQPVKVKRQAVPDGDIAVLLHEHPFALPGKTERVTLKLPRCLMHDLIETFGTRYLCTDNTDPVNITVTLRAGERDVVRFVLSQAPLVQLQKPEKLCREVSKTADMLKNANQWKIVPFDRDAKIRSALGKDGILRLHEMDLTGTDAYKHLTGVLGVELIHTNLTDLSFLAEYPALQYVHIENEDVTDLSVLTQLPALTRLELIDLSLDSSDFLRGCTHLHRLMLDECCFKNGDAPLFDMPWLRVLCASPIDLRNVDMHALRKANPLLSVLTDLNDMYDQPVSLEPVVYRSGSAITPPPCPFGVMLICAIFGGFPEELPPDYVAWLTENGEFQKESECVLAMLGINEQKVVKSKLAGHGTVEISAEIGLSCEAVQRLYAHALRMLRHPSRARRLRPYGLTSWSNEEKPAK